MKKFSVILAILISFQFFAEAQQLSFDNQYLINRYALSPTYAGFNGNFETFLNYRQDWVGMPGAPVKSMISTNGQLADKMGFGVSINSETSGNFSHFITDLSYAYHLPLSEKQTLSFALETNVFRSQLNIANIGSQGADPVIMTGTGLIGSSFDATAAVMYRMGNLNLGFAADRLIGSNISLDKETGSIYEINRQFLGHVSYFYDVNNFRFEPNVVVRSSTDLLLDVAVSVYYKKQVWINTLYRSNKTVAVNVGASVFDNLILNYAYEIGTGGLGGHTAGSHEISIGFLIQRAKIDRGLPTAFRPATGGDAFLRKYFEEKIETINKNLTTVEKDYKNYKTKTGKDVAILQNQIDSLKKVKPGTSVVTKKEVVSESKYDREIILRNIKFAKGSDALFTSSYPQLNRLAAQLAKRRTMHILIVGHTDNVGSVRSNKALSKKRAESVKRYLVDKRKIKEGRITVDGMGEDVPLSANDTEANKAKNRRIEVKFTDTKKRG